jgi:hypothetical protein
MVTKIRDIIFYLCSFLLIFSAVIYLFDWTFTPYLYAASGAGVAIMLLANPYKEGNLRLQRLNIQQAIAALLLPVSSYFMFKGMNEWFVCLLVSAILQGYVAFVRDYEEKKARKDKK